MKVVDPSTAPIPGRKPEPPAPAAMGPSFQAVLSESGTLPVPARKPEIPPVRIANGQSVPPPPGRKPDAPPPVETAEDAAAKSIVLASQQVAGLSGHSFTAILAQATQESGLNPAAKSRTSSAAGPFQFLERTWLHLFRQHGAAYGLGDLARQIDLRDGVPVVKNAAVRQQILAMRHDVDIAAGMAARYLSEGRDNLAARLKRPVTETESRIAYVMGVAGAAKLIRAAEKQPDVAAASLLPAAAKANGPLFYERGTGRALTAQETVARLSRRMETDQRELFAAIDRADQKRMVIDGSPSPLNPFQSVDSGETPAGRTTG